jgi:hypothetical protein
MALGILSEFHDDDRASPEASTGRIADDQDQNSSAAARHGASQRQQCSLKLPPTFPWTAMVTEAMSR